MYTRAQSCTKDVLRCSGRLFRPNLLLPARCGQKTNANFRYLFVFLFSFQFVSRTCTYKLLVPCTLHSTTTVYNVQVHVLCTCAIHGSTLIKCRFDKFYMYVHIRKRTLHIIYLYCTCPVHFFTSTRGIRFVQLLPLR